MPTPAQNKATTKYIKTHMRQFVFRCNKEGDADVIAYLESCGNINGELKRLVREAIKKQENI